VYLVPRSGNSPSDVNSIGDPITTDSNIAVVQMQECHAAVPELAEDPEAAPFKPGSAVFRYLRRDVLTVRSDMLRANIIYATFDVLRMGFRAWKHRTPATVAAAPNGKPAQAMVDSTNRQPAIAAP
jgi:hypothetical protein